MISRRALIFLSLIIGLSPAAAQPVSPFHYTYHRADGNRFIEGRGTFPSVDELALPFVGVRPVWVVGAINATRPFWVIARRDSQSDVLLKATLYESGGRGLGYLSDELRETPLDMPLLVTALDPPGAIIASAGSPLTHPIFVQEHFLYIDQAGSILLAQRGRPLAQPLFPSQWAQQSIFITGSGQFEAIMLAALPLNALPDARMVVNRRGQIAVYVGAMNERYPHGVLGDDLEASALVVLEIVGDQLRVVTRVDLPANDVFEGLAPFWADVDGDSADDLVTTVSNDTVGAQLRVYRLDGTLLAAGDPAGQARRWRHQLAFAAFGPNGEKELVDVLTPHIGGVVEFLRLRGNRLEVVAIKPGYTSHVLGSRNLDMAVAGDFNGDGQPEIVLTDQSRTQVVGLQRTPAGVEALWTLPLNGTLSTNFAAVTLPNNTLALAAGTEDGWLRVWVSK